MPSAAILQPGKFPPPTVPVTTIAELQALISPPPLAARFCEKLTVEPAPVPELSPCLLWTRGITTKGYGKFFFEGRDVEAHLWLWRQLRGPVPDGLELHHFCHEAAWEAGLCEGGYCVHRRCVIHLQPITHRQNMLRGATFQAEEAARDWCTGKHGPHDLRNPKNVYHPPDPKRANERHCRPCVRERVREHRANQQKLLARATRYGEQLPLLDL